MIYTIVILHSHTLVHMIYTIVILYSHTLVHMIYTNAVYYKIIYFVVSHIVKN